MRVELASTLAIAYACEHFHYAQRCSPSFIGYNVYNEANEWCGCICFSRGVRTTASPFGLLNGEVAELIRVALNGRQACTSQALMRAVRQFAKDAPLVQLLVSYADTEQGHRGIIYQATNWCYLGEIKSHPRWIDPRTNREVHGRGVPPLATQNARGEPLSGVIKRTT